MDAIVPYAIWAAIIITVLGVIAVLIFSIRNLFYGKVSPLSLVVGAIPLAIWVILGLTLSDWTEAAILTALITMALGLLALLLASFRGLFSF